MQQIKKVKGTDRTFDRYLSAMVNLYGQITLGDAFEIIQHLNNSKYNFSDLVAFAKKIQQNQANEKDNRPYSVYLPSAVSKEENNTDLKEILIVHRYLTTEQRYFMMEFRNHEYPYYVPDRELFLFFAESPFMLTFGWRELCLFLLKHKSPKSFITEEDFLYWICFSFRTGASISTVMERISPYLYFPESPSQRREMFEILETRLRIIQEYTREWQLHGFAPVEIEYLNETNRKISSLDRFEATENMPIFAECI